MQKFNPMLMSHSTLAVFSVTDFINLLEKKNIQSNVKPMFEKHFETKRYFDKFHNFHEKLLQIFVKVYVWLEKSRSLFSNNFHILMAFGLQ